MSPGRRSAPGRPATSVSLDWVGALLRVAIAVVWLSVGAGQLFTLGQPPAGTSYLVPHHSSATAVTGLLPWFELGLGTLLLFGIGVRIVAALSATLWTALVVTTSTTSASGIGLPFHQICLSSPGCLTVVSDHPPSSVEILVAAVSLSALCVWLVIRPRCAATIDNLLTRPPRNRTRRAPSHAARTNSLFRRSATVSRRGSPSNT